MNYAKIYGSLIDRARNRLLVGYKESHHVTPRCMGGDDSPENLVDLTPEEHYLAHLVLVKMYPGNRKLVYAANMMCSTVGKRNNKLFGWLRRKMALAMVNDNPMRRDGIAEQVAETRRTRGNLGRGPVTAEERAEISKRMRQNNPNKGQDPWDNVNSTPISLQIWQDAEKYYQWWSVNKKGYCAMATAFGFKNWGAPHQNMVKKFKSGWIPSKDPRWVNFTSKWPTAV